MRRMARILAIGAAAALAAPTLALAHHPDHGFGGEAFPGEGVAVGAHQHDGSDGHIPPVAKNVRVVGKAEITNPTPGQENDGRAADVFHYKNYAFITAFREPTCQNAGVHVIDIKDLKNPFEVKEAFIPTSPASYAGEGIQVLKIDNATFKGDVLIHQNETCPGQTPALGKGGGISLWDVSDPINAKELALHAGDQTFPTLAPRPFASQVHSMFAWNNTFDGKTYVVLVDDEELTDVDILDISDPRKPVMVNDELDLVELFGVDQETPDNLTSVFSHDMMVQKIGKRYVMNMNYWDGGYVLLDVTDPTPGNVQLIADSDYALLDEERLARGHEISPEGNAHQSEISKDAKYLIGTDEDFNPYRVTATITGGPFAGTRFVGASGSDVPEVDADTSIIGTPTYVGTACGIDDPPTPGVPDDVVEVVPPAPAGGGVALVQRGVCTFQEKLDSVKAAGYTSGVVFNALRADCQGLVNMAVVGDIPFVFVQRSTGLRILGTDPGPALQACSTPTPAAATANAIDIRAIFDGWGYVRLYKTEIPKAGGAGSIEQIDTYTVPEAQDPKYAEGFGDLSVHEVAIDPRERLAYFSYYSAGFRVAKFGKNGIREVGAFIDEGGSNFWGVDIIRRKGKTYVLASDRDFGLYVFQYTGRR